MALAGLSSMVNALSVLAFCPSCPTAIEARALVFSDGFWVNAAYAVLPFLVAAFVVHKFVKRLDQGAGHEEQRHE
jgi:hypothetical protein